MKRVRSKRIVMVGVGVGGIGNVKGQRGETSRHTEGLDLRVTREGKSVKKVRL